MTNLEWIRTLSEEEFADWLYDEWLHHLQYRWSSSRGGLIIWLKDHKDEPRTDGYMTADYPQTIIGERFPSYITENNAQVLDGWQINPRTSTTVVEEEPQTHCPIAIIFSCDECPHPTNCKYKTDCKRCRHFATDTCRECYGNELFEESGYITELTNTR